MNDVFAIKNSNIVYAVGGFSIQEGDVYKLIIKSIDKGVTWTQINSPFDTRLYHVCFLDTLNGFICGSREFMKTNDGGNTFDTLIIYNSPASYMTSIYFTCLDTGYIAGSNGLIIKTTNGGGPITGIKNQFYNEFEPEFNLFSNHVNDILIIFFRKNTWTSKYL